MDYIKIYRIEFKNFDQAEDYLLTKYIWNGNNAYEKLKDEIKYYDSKYIYFYIREDNALFYCNFNNINIPIVNLDRILKLKTL